MFTKIVSQIHKDGPVNSCGKPTHIISDLEFFKRFLMLGTENGTYYIEKRNLTEQHFEGIDIPALSIHPYTHSFPYRN